MGVLRLREFRLLFGAQAVSVLGDRMVAIALAFAVIDLGGSASDIGIVLAVRMLPMVATLLIGGVVADRVSRRAVMVIADLVRLVTQGAIGVLLITDAAQIWMVAALSGLTGAATGFFNPASTGLLSAIVPPEHLQEASGMRATALSGGEIVGPALAGVLIAAVGAGWALALDALTFAASALFLLGLRLPAHVPRPEQGSFLAELREGWGVFRSLTWVWTFVLAASVGNLVWGAWSTLGPVIAERELGGAAAWGTVLGAIGIGALIGALLAVRIRVRRPLLLAAATFALLAPPLAFLAAGAHVGLLALAGLFSGLGMMLGNSLWEATLVRHVPRQALSRVSAYDWFGSMAFQPLGLAIWGPVAAIIGVSTSLWLAFALALATTALLLVTPAIRELRDEPLPPVPQPAV